MLVAEFLGAALLTTTVLVLTHSTAVTFFVAASAGVALAVVTMMLGAVSGAHTNPAITVGLWTARRVETTQAIAYVASQLLGGLAAWRLFEYLANTTVNTRSGEFDSTIWMAELIGTFLLAMGFAAVMTRKLDGLQSAMLLGTSFFLGIMIAGVASAGLLNPAVALGLRSWDSAYVFGPLLGGILGINLYMMLFGPERVVADRRVAAGTVSKARRKSVKK